MRYSVGTLLYGLLFSAPGWAVGLFNIGEPAMWAGFVAGSMAYAPFLATACFPRMIEAAIAHD